MAAEKKRIAGELAAWHVIELIKRIPFASEAPSVNDLNPYRHVDPVIAEKKSESATRRFFEITEHVLFGQQVHKR